MIPLARLTLSLFLIDKSSFKRTSLVRKNSAVFMNNLVECDEGIIFALHRRNAIAEERTHQLVKKLEDKEKERSQREEVAMRRDRQLSWLVVASLMTRIR